MQKIICLFLLCAFTSLQAHVYLLKKYDPFQDIIPSPEEFLGYGIGDRLTRHDLIEAYFKKLVKESAGSINGKAKPALTHQLGFRYSNEVIPVYKNNTAWQALSNNKYSTVAKYTAPLLIDVFITYTNRYTYLIPTASVLFSSVVSGRAVLFADYPDFRGSWFGTNLLFLNALFLGNHINVPK